MPKTRYREIRFRSEVKDRIALCDAIIDSYARDGLDITLRQLYYQLVAHHGLENSLRSYKRLVDTITNARYAGLIDWTRVVDRTRYLRKLPDWTDPSEIVRGAADQYQIDKWSVDYQSNRPVVLIEKDALLGIFMQACEPLQVPVLSCRGYTSASEMWRMSERLRDWMDQGQRPFILHFGDHDPSGQDMSRDILDRLTEFCGGGDAYDFERLALNINQVRRYQLPPYFAKITDSRYSDYVAQYGKDAFELDALDARVLSGLVRKTVESLRDQKAWDSALASEAEDRAILAASSDNWTKIKEALKKKPKRGEHKLIWKRMPKRKKAKRAAKKRPATKARRKRAVK